MASSLSERFLAAQTLLMLALLCLLILFDLFEISLFLILSLVGLVLLWEFMSPFHVRPRWFSDFRRLVAIGYVAFAVYALYVIYSTVTGQLGA